MWFKEFHGIGTVEENLADAAAGENFEWTDMYDRMAKEQTNKDSMNWLRNSVVLLLWKLLMRQDIIAFWNISNR